MIDNEQIITTKDFALGKDCIFTFLKWNDKGLCPGIITSWTACLSHSRAPKIWISYNKPTCFSVYSRALKTTLHLYHHHHLPPKQTKKKKLEAEVSEMWLFWGRVPRPGTSSYRHTTAFRGSGNHQSRPIIVGAANSKTPEESPASANE